VIEAMLSDGDLERVAPSIDHAAELIDQARQHLASVNRISGEDPTGAFQLMYDAARKSMCAILESQGLRPTGRGGHLAVIEAVSAQLDPPMGRVIRPFNRLRRRRNDAEYPQRSVSRPSSDEVVRDVTKVEEMLNLASPVINQMSPF